MSKFEQNCLGSDRFRGTEIKHHLKTLAEDFEAMLADAASFIAQVDLKHEDSVKLYSVLGHIAANVSVLSEIVNKIND